MTDSPQSTDQPSEKPKRRYGWWLFFAFTVLLASLALTFLVPAYRQLALIERIEAVGGTVDTEPAGPEWVRNFVCEKRMRGFDDVVQVVVIDPQINDEFMQEIAILAKLRWLNLSYTQVSDKGLMYLEGLSNLEWLDLTRTQVTDAGITHLKGLTSLKTLVLSNTQITDVGLSHLTGLIKLRWLDLNKTQVTDAGLVHLKGLPNLAILELLDTRVSEVGANELQAALPHCEISH